MDSEQKSELVLVDSSESPLLELKNLVEQSETKISQQKKTVEDTQLLLLKIYSQQENSNNVSRIFIAFILLLCIGGTITATFWYVFTIDNESGRELITLLWTSQIGLISSAIGYYFGTSGKLKDNQFESNIKDKS